MTNLVERGALVLIAFASACSETPVPAIDPHSVPTAILPIRPQDVRITPLSTGPAEPNTVIVKSSAVTHRDEISSRANKALDSLASGYGAWLVGPSRVASILDEASLAKLRVCLDDPGPLTETWKVKGLSEVARFLGVTRLIRFMYQVEASLERSSKSGEQAYDWRGRVVVVADEFALEDSKRTARSSEEGGFQKRTDLLFGAAPAPGGGFALPIVSGKGLSGAIDQATFQVFKNLLQSREK